MLHLVVFCMAAIVVLTAFPSRERPARAATSVDLVLVLAIDVSGSVDEEEFDLQRRGLASAFRHPLVIDAIRGGSTRRIAVTVVQWAGMDRQRVSVPWVVVSDAANAGRLSDRLVRMPRDFPDGPTNLSGVLRFSTRLIAAAPFVGARRVIDISGDGQNNIGDPPPQARDAAVQAGITINGLVITNASAGLTAYFRAEVIGGPGAFVVTAADYADYRRAILQKLIREISIQLS